MKIRITYSKTGIIRFTSHRDLMRIFFRVFSRIKMPILYSEGYSPHPRVTFCPPLKVGMEGLNELMDVSLTEPIGEEEIVLELNRYLPRGVRVGGVIGLPQEAKSLGKWIREAEYQVYLPDRVRVTEQDISKFMAAEEVPVEYLKVEKTKTVNARQGVSKIRVMKQSGEREDLWMLLSVRENGRPYEVLSALSGLDHDRLIGLRWRRLRFYGPLKVEKGVA
ncbi:MAG: TIGR03936 family radical SAM-associated protein [Candidatus Auribacterota bacterium]|nr:TIGR03936 family radical SAM-associated protein [Candidatus Auribacterota bacterium]